MSKFNVGDILKSKNKGFAYDKHIHVLVTHWREQNEKNMAAYSLVKLNDGSEHTWSAPHVDNHYERLS